MLSAKCVSFNYATEPGAKAWKLLQHLFRPITHKKPLEIQFSATTLPCNKLKADMQHMFDDVEQYY